MLNKIAVSALLLQVFILFLIFIGEERSVVAKISLVILMLLLITLAYNVVRGLRERYDNKGLQIHSNQISPVMAPPQVVDRATQRSVDLMLELEELKRTTNKLAQQAALVTRVDWPNEQPKPSDVVITERGTVVSYDDFIDHMPGSSVIKHVLRINQEYL